MSRTSSSSPASRHTGRCASQLADVARASLTQTRATPALVTAGVSGLTARDADADALLALVADTGIRGAILAHDSTTSFLGALGDRHGAVVAAGTGVVTLAVGPRATALDGDLGYIMGDAGSGYWIGREALDAVMRAYDGRGPATVLTDAVRERWPDLSQAYMALQAEEERVNASSPRSPRPVARAADDGYVKSALRITQAAGTQLARSVRAAIARVRDDDERFAVCALGGVFRSRSLQTAFEDALTDG